MIGERVHNVNVIVTIDIIGSTSNGGLFYVVDFFFSIICSDFQIFSGAYEI